MVLIGCWWWWWGSGGGGGGDSLSKVSSGNCCMSALVRCMMCGDYFGDSCDDCGACGGGSGSDSGGGGGKKSLQPLLTPLPLPTSQMPPPNIQINKLL